MPSSPSIPSASGVSAEQPAIIVYADDLHAFTREEVATRMHLGLQAVDAAIADGRLQVVRLGRAVRIPAASLRSFIYGGAS